jgi:hypothetical protein
MERGNFGGMVYIPGGETIITGGHSFTYGAGGGVDLCFGSKKSKCWRNGVTLSKAFNDDISKTNVMFQTGLAFKF